MDPNPFRHQDPIRDRDVFFNRDADVREVLTRLRKGQNVSVIGKEKADRTSFLLQVSDPQAAARHGLVLQDHLFCYLDCKQLADLGDDDRFGRIKAALEKVISDWEAPIPVPEDIAGSDAYYWLDQTLFLFDRAGIQLTLQLDDFDRLDRLTRRFLGKLRSLETHDALTWLTASRVPLVELQSERPSITGSPFFDVFWDHELGPFNPDKCCRLLAAGLETVEVTFSEGVLEFIAHLSQGEPWRMQLACACAYDVWYEKGKEELCDEDCGEIEERFKQELRAACGDCT